VNRVLALLYHDIYATHPSESGFPGPAAARYKLSVLEFERQFDLLMRAMRWVDGVGALPQPVSGDGLPIHITVDDGGIACLRQLADRLEIAGLRGHCFITTGYIGQRGFLGKQEIRELHARGHVIGSHSVSHPSRFATLSYNAMLEEWMASRRTLQDITGAEISTASVPGGFYTRRVAVTASQAGLRQLFTSEPETGVRRVRDCEVIGRYAIRRGCGADFAARLAAGDTTLLIREWLIWNAKYALKTCLGERYPQLADWVTRPQTYRWLVH
jgi:peptidoglycan/xylan/chitin deacetylase (PgdA/CDA1 family)